MALRGRTTASLLQRLSSIQRSGFFEILEIAQSPADNPCKRNETSSSNGGLLPSSIHYSHSFRTFSSSCDPLFSQERLDAQQKRRHSQISSSPSETFTYHGPLSQTLKNLKRLSITGCAVSIFGSPLLVMGTTESMPLAAQASICFTIASFGIFTTSLLNWFVSPYVHQLDFDRKSRLLKVKTLNVLAQERQNHFPESDLRFPDTMRPQVTFEVNGKFYYLDPNAFTDKDLLMRLTPQEPGVAEAVPIPEDRGKDQH